MVLLYTILRVCLYNDVLGRYPPAGDRYPSDRYPPGRFPGEGGRYPYDRYPGSDRYPSGDRYPPGMDRYPPSYPMDR